MAHDNIHNQKLITNQAKTQSNSVAQDLMDSLKSIKSAYDAKMPKADYSLIDNMASQQISIPSAQEIRKEAEQNLEQYKTTGISKIEQKYDANIYKLQSQTNKATNDYNNSIASQKAQVNNKLNSLYAKNIAQGIMHSSITDNEVDDITRHHISDMAQKQGEYLAKLNSLQLQKDVVQQERANALADFDISYANKLNKQLNVLTSQYNTALKNAQQYQDIIDNKRQEIKADFDAKYGQTVKKLTQDMQREMTLDAFVKLKDLPRSEVQQILNTNPEVKEYLGDWYSALKLWLYR